MLDDTNKICGRDTDKWCFITEKYGTTHKKSKNLQPVKDIVDVFDYYQKEDKSDYEVYENSNTDVESSIKNMKQYKDEFFKNKYINIYKLQNIDEIVIEDDKVQLLYCYSWKCASLLKYRIKYDSILECKFIKWMDDILTDRECV